MFKIQTINGSAFFEMYELTCTNFKNSSGLEIQWVRHSKWPSPSQIYNFIFLMFDMIFRSANYTIMLYPT